MKTYDERTEKNLATLAPAAQAAARAFLAVAVPAMAAQGVTLKIICGNRTHAEQNALYAQGRTKPGPIVTNARGGESRHNSGRAWDIGLFRGKVYLEESPLYHECAAIGHSCGLNCGAFWTKFPDPPHYETR